MYKKAPGSPWLNGKLVAEYQKPDLGVLSRDRKHAWFNRGYLDSFVLHHGNFMVVDQDLRACRIIPRPFLYYFP